MDFTAPISNVIPGARGVVLGILAATDAALTGNKIAELSDGAVSQSGVSKAMAPLVASGVVRVEHAGPANLYTLNRDHVAAGAVVAAADLRNELLARMTAAAQAWEVVAVAVVLFGSAARATAGTASDIDVLVIRPDGVSPDDPRWEAQTMVYAADVGRWSGNGCRLLEYSESEYYALVAADDRLVHGFRNEGIVLAGRSPRELAAPPQ
jgi:hypothetical protein